MVDTAQALAEFERYLHAREYAEDWHSYEVAAKRPLAFLDWLGKRFVDDTTRAEVSAAFEASEREREAAEAEVERAREEEETQRRAAQARREQEEQDRKAVETKLAAAREAARQEEVAAARVRAAAAARATLTEHLADPVWVRGDDPDALRALAEWQRTNPETVQLMVQGGDNLRDTMRALDHEVQAAAKARAAAITDREAHHWERLLKDEPEPVVSPLVNLAELIDVDGIARWLAAHIGSYTLRAGRRVTAIEYEKEVTRLNLPDDWRDIAARVGRWLVYAKLKAEVREHPELAERLMELEAALFVDGTLSANLGRAVEEEADRWRSRCEPDAPEDDIDYTSAPNGEVKLTRQVHTFIADRWDDGMKRTTRKQVYRHFGRREGVIDGVLAWLTGQRLIEQVGTHEFQPTEK